MAVSSLEQRTLGAMVYERVHEGWHALVVRFSQQPIYLSIE